MFSRMRSVISIRQEEIHVFKWFQVLNCFNLDNAVAKVCIRSVPEVQALRRQFNTRNAPQAAASQQAWPLATCYYPSKVRQGKHGHRGYRQSSLAIEIGSYISENPPYFSSRSCITHIFSKPKHRARSTCPFRLRKSSRPRPPPRGVNLHSCPPTPRVRG